MSGVLIIIILIILDIMWDFCWDGMRCGNRDEDELAWHIYSEYDITEQENSGFRVNVYFSLYST
jgi:hypothetical protein